MSVAGWVTLGMGVVHVGITPVLYGAGTADAVWFAAGGLALALIGALDLLARDAPAGAPVCRVAAMANAAGALLLGLGLEWISRWRAPQGWLFLALAVAAGVAAVSPCGRRASRSRAGP